MASSSPDRELFRDPPVRALFLCLLGLFSLVVALTVRGALRLREAPAAPAPPRPTPAPTPTPQPTSPQLYSEDELRTHLARWRVEHEGATLRLTDPTRGAQLEQQERTTNQGAKSVLEGLDERLSRWGQEYQRLSLEGGTTQARLEYVLNLPGQPELRGVTLATRVRRAGKKRVWIHALTADDRFFPGLADELHPLGLRFRDNAEPAR